MKFMRPYPNIIYFCALLLCLLPGIALADLSITVEPNRGWGNAPTSNIKALCENVSLHFQEQLRDENKLNGKLTIIYNAGGPVAFYRHAFGGASDEYKIGLVVTDTYWAQFSYQFAHEFCHIMLDFERTHPNNPNIWFYEALCELANLWVIRQMGETWEHRPPYPNWAGWRPNLTNYANNLINSPEVQYTGSAKEWLTQWEDRMRNQEPGVFSYKRVAQLSYKFLPIFEEHPEAWNAIRQISGSTEKMPELMKDWHNRVNPEDKQFVEDIAEVMGISLTTNTIASIDFDADVNNDNRIDLSDVLIVRNAINGSSLYDTDINNDGITNEIDLLIVKAKAHEAITAAAPRLHRRKITSWAEFKRR